MIKRKHLSSNERKRIEAKAWQGVSNLDSQPSKLGEIYTEQTDNFLLNRSIQHFDLYGKKIINVGGGHGKEAEFLIKNGATRVIIVDVAIGQLKSAKIRKEKHGLYGLEFILGDAESLPFKEKAFDLGYIHSALHHFPDHNKSVSDICRTSKELIFVDIMDALITRILNLFGFFRREWYRIEPNRLNEKEVKGILSNKKMNAKITYFFIPPYYGNNILILQCIKFISKIINFAEVKELHQCLVIFIEGKAK